MSQFRLGFARLGFKKDVDRLLEEAQSKQGLAKTLGAKDLIVLGVAGIIGAGIFVLIGQGIAAAGAGVVPAFVVAALICAVAGYAYAELASTIPASGSAYAYIYTAMGELPGWMVAWALILEYAVGAITVAVGWRNNLLALINQFKDSDPTTDIFANPQNYWWTHSILETATSGAETLRGVIDIPAAVIVLLCTLLLVRGTKESAKFTFVLVIIKVAILLLAIVGGFLAFNAANFDDPLPHSLADDPNTLALNDAVQLDDARSFFGAFSAIMAAAAIMFFAYIGFDSVSTTAEETRNPKKDLPKGILGSLFITTALYIIAAVALVSASHWTDYVGTSTAAANARGEPFGYVFEKTGFLCIGDTEGEGCGGLALGALLVRIGALVGTTSVLLVLILGGVRVFFNMSRDGLLPGWMSRVSARGSPALTTLLYGSVTAAGGLLLNQEFAVNLVNIGTLFAFLMVILAVWVFRIRRPDIERPFRMPMWNVITTRNGKPALPLLTILGSVGVVGLILSLDAFTLFVSIAWAGLGFLVYAFYGVRNSKEAAERFKGK